MISLSSVFVLLLFLRDNLTPGPCCVCHLLCLQGTVKLISLFSNLRCAQYAPTPCKHPALSLSSQQDVQLQCALLNPTNQYWQHWQSGWKYQVMNSEHLLITATWKAPFPSHPCMLCWFLFCSKALQNKLGLCKTRPGGEFGTTLRLTGMWDPEGKFGIEKCWVCTSL